MGNALTDTKTNLEVNKISGRLIHNIRHELVAKAMFETRASQHYPQNKVSYLGWVATTSLL